MVTMHISMLLLLLVGGAATTDVSTVERWRMAEFEWRIGPNATEALSNPFLEVQLSAAFTLLNDTESFLAAGDPPTPLVALDLATGNQSTVSNIGSSAQSCPSAGLIAVKRSDKVPAGSSGQSLDLGADVTRRHAVQLPPSGQAFHGGLPGLSAFTITGWILVQGEAEGAGN